ncbi:MAG TPA: hypothetical protein VKI19_12345, partial [Acidimicrobiales bacterium]|nr:hypothetical protein [Acidimicrobiales bacterium]
FGIMFAWPWIDKRIYNDYRSHNLLDRPRDKPFRTGVGVAAIIFFSDLTLACGTDLLANNLHIAFERLIEVLQYGVFVGPIVGFLIAYKACQALARTGAHPIQRPLGGVIYRTAEGAYHTVGDVHGHDDHRHAPAENGHGNGRVVATAAPTGTAPAAAGAATGAGEHAPEPVGGE